MVRHYCETSVGVLTMMAITFCIGIHTIGRSLSSIQWTDPPVPNAFVVLDKCNVLRILKCTMVKFNLSTEAGY